MALEILSLGELLNSEFPEEDIKELLFSFCTLKTKDAEGADDVESFLHNKAIQFEKLDLARTYLVMSKYQGRSYMAGYFSISNRPLIINRKNFQKLSGSLKRRLMGVGHKTEQETYEIKGFLLGQLGKNYSEIAKDARSLSGADLLQLACDKIQEAYKLIGGRIIYLECEDNDKIKSFYTSAGFLELQKFKSPNGYCLMVRKLERA